MQDSDNQSTLCLIIEDPKIASMKYLTQFYEKQAKDFYQNEIFTNNQVKSVISVIENAELKKEQVEPSIFSDSSIADAYEIVMENGKKLLKDKFTQQFIVGLEDSFDVLKKAHIKTNHGGGLEIYNEVKSKYNIDLQCTNHFATFCNISKIIDSQKNTKSLHILGKVAEVYIVDMNQPDNAFSSILVYIDLKTQYTLLRPLITKTQNEISCELCKIFTDFGTPSTLLVHRYHNLIMLKALKVTRKIIPTEIKLQSILDKDTMEIRNKQIISYLMKWIEESGSQSWAIGCHVVQYQINHVAHKNNKSAFHQTFGLPGIVQDCEKFTENLAVEVASSSNVSKLNPTEVIDCIINTDNTKPFEVEVILEDSSDSATSVSTNDDQCGLTKNTGIQGCEIFEEAITDNYKGPICPECSKIVTELNMCSGCDRLVHLFCATLAANSSKLFCKTCANTEAATASVNPSTSSNG